MWSEKSVEVLTERDGLFHRHLMRQVCELHKTSVVEKVETQIRARNNQHAGRPTAFLKLSQEMAKLVSMTFPVHGVEHNQPGCLVATLVLRLRPPAWSFRYGARHEAHYLQRLGRGGSSTRNGESDNLPRPRSKPTCA